MPFGSINPKLPGWQEDVRRCAQHYKMPGIRLHPNYHGYELRDPAFAGLLHAAAELRAHRAAGCLHGRHAHTAPADARRAGRFIRAGRGGETRAYGPPGAAQLGAGPVGQRLQSLVDAGPMYFDISTVEGIEGVGRLVERLSPKRILFGSNFPLFYFESALLKMQNLACRRPRSRK